MKANSSNIIIRYTLITLTTLFTVACSSEEKHEREADIRMEITELNFEHPTCGTDEGPCVTLNFMIPEFFGTQPVSDSLQRWSDQQIHHFDPDSNIVAPEIIAEEWFNDYEDYAGNIEDYNLSWSLERRVDIVYKNPVLISLHFNEFSFTGGAHPIQIDLFQSFQIPEGTQINLNDLTSSPANMERLISVGEQRFRSVYGLSDGDRLDESDFWFAEGDFFLPENFAFTDYGLLFYYNVYEIAPYAAGPVIIELSYPEIEPLLDSRWIQKNERLTIQFNEH